MSLCGAGNRHNESKIKKFSEHNSYFLGREENSVTYKESINDCLLQRHQNLEFGADKDFIDSDDSFEAHADRWKNSGLSKLGLKHEPSMEGQMRIIIS